MKTAKETLYERLGYLTETQELVYRHERENGASVYEALQTALLPEQKL